MNKNTLPLSRLGTIFLAMHGCKKSQKFVTVAEIEQFQPAETFSEFLDVNQLPVYEMVLR